jgi:hypothetical protein
MIQTSKECLFSGKELPEDVFLSRYSNYYFLDSDMMHLGDNHEKLVSIIQLLLNAHNDNKIYLTKLHNKTENEGSIEFVIRKNKLDSDLVWVMKYNLFLYKPEIIIQSLNNPYGNPTLIFSDSGKWAFYYLYEDEVIVIASEHKLELNSINDLNDLILLSIEKGKVVYQKDEISDFLNRLVLQMWCK